MKPADVCCGRREEILRRKEEENRATPYERFRYNLGQNSDPATVELGVLDRSMPDGLS